MPEQRPASACPEVEMMAAYVDGTLDAGTRADISAHVSTCERCYELVAELAREQEAEGTVSRPRRLVRWLPIAASLLIGAVGLVTLQRMNPAWWSRLWSSGTDPRLAPIIEIIGERRIVEGRLTGGFAFGPLVEPTRGAAAGDNLSLVAAAGTIQQRAERSPTPENLHAWGVAQLALGRYDQSVDTLEDVVSERPDVARYANDLGVARLARATALNRADDLPLGLEHIERAIERDGNLAEAWFNKALALERLRLPRQALDAWQRYLELDPDGAWSAEARARRDKLRAAPAQGRWPAIEQDLRSTSSDAALVEAARDFPEDLRDLLVSDWLPSWAAAVTAGSPKDEAAALARLERAAAVLEREYADGYLPRAVRELRRVRGRLDVATGIRALADGTAGIAADRSGEARVALERALTSFQRARSSLTTWTILQLAHVAYVQRRYTAVSALLDAADADARRLDSPSLAARAAWLDGILAFTTGAWQRAAERYADALRDSARAGDPQLMARVHLNASVLYSFLGHQELTWVHRLAATDRVPAHRPFQVHGYLISGAGTASLQSLRLTALQFQGEVVKHAFGRLPAGPRAEALMARARMRARARSQAEAEEDLQRAEEQVAAVTDPAMQVRLRRTWLVAAADVRLESRPADAAAHAREAVAISGGLEPMRSAEVRLLETRALARAGDVNAAQESARQGIADFESALATIDPGDATRLSALEPVWDLYAEGARLHLPPLAEEFDQAFALLERSRTRTLLERRRMQPLGLAEVQARLHVGQAVLLLQQFRDELLTWDVRRDRVDVRTAACPEADVAALVARHRRSIAAGVRRDAASAALFDCAIRPWWASRRGVSSLAVVPDAAWQRVAWPALWDRASNTDLIAVVDPVVAFSATVAVAADRPSQRAGVLVVSSTLGGDDLAPLPSARDEARAIAQLHPGAHLLEDSSATPETFTAQAAQANLIHIASHAIDMPAYPLLSHLVLAGANPRLFARNVARLDLSHTDLVVLAACTTAGRRSVRGEGSVGVAWSFLAAGARRVIATLDEVDDGASNRLYVDVHRELAKGASPVHALGRVQRALAARGESPRVWAGVIVLGAL